jgi:hypothetical protein
VNRIGDAPGGLPDPGLGACGVVPEQHLKRGWHVGAVQPDGDEPGVLGDLPDAGRIEFRADPRLSCRVLRYHDDDRVNPGQALIE